MIKAPSATLPLGYISGFQRGFLQGVGASSGGSMKMPDFKFALDILCLRTPMRYKFTRG